MVFSIIEKYAMRLASYVRRAGNDMSAENDAVNIIYRFLHKRARACDIFPQISWRETSVGIITAISNGRMQSVIISSHPISWAASDYACLSPSAPSVLDECN